MRLSGITPESLVDGPGLRFVIFTQGCQHKCPHCHNPETWDMDAGKEYSVKQVIRLLKKQKKTKQGVTFSGGEPFLQAAELAEVALTVHQIGWDIVTYTGFTYEELTENKDSGVKALLSASDILIDGKYIHKLRSIELPFRGSSNQRIIDLAKTRKKEHIVLWKPLNSR
jgi:anaerobic ribonucleoside-triphosphate reductase activating protein